VSCEDREISSVELTSVDVYLSMDEIYKRIDFDEPLVDD